MQRIFADDNGRCNRGVCFVSSVAICTTRFLACAFLLVAIACIARSAPLDDESQACQSCHGISDWRIREAVSGRELVLSIDTARYQQSVHGSTACRACHDWGYDKIPHRGSGGHGIYLCVVCHDQDEGLFHFQLRQRKADLQASVHGRDAEQPLDCHTCHDPHLFRPVNDADDALQRIATSNDICLTCHGPNRGQAVDPQLADVSLLHGMFPNYENHVRKVKCVACHSADTSETRHDVLPKERSLRDCARCHTPDSQILQSVYNPRGPTADDLAENAYVIGSTRSPRLERLSVIGFAVTMFAIVAHGLARLIYAFRTRGSDES
jgi:hypothetical protein